MVCKTILGVVAFCHHNHIVHRDLKPENFLFMDETYIEDGGRLMSIDFGFSTHFLEEPLTQAILLCIC